MESKEVYSAGPCAFVICGMTPISPSKSYSPASFSLPYISAITLPMQILPLPSSEAPEPSTQPLLVICFILGDSLQLSCAEMPSVLLVEDTLPKANATCLQTFIMLCTCGSMHVGLGKKTGLQTHTFGWAFPCSMGWDDHNQQIYLTAG